jgi:hypothetical protein
MDTSNMDQRQKEYINLARDEVLAKRRMLAINMNALTTVFGGYGGYVGMGAPAGVFGAGYGDVGAPAGMFGGGMAGMGDIAGMGLGSVADVGGMGLGGFGSTGGWYLWSHGSTTWGIRGLYGIFSSSFNSRC